MPILYTAQMRKTVRQQKSVETRQGHTALGRAFLRELLYIRLASLYFIFGRGPFLYPFPRKGLFIYSSRKYILCFISSKCFSFDDGLERQFSQFLNLVENIFHLFRSCDKLAFLPVHFILDDITTFALLCLDVGFKINNRNLAILQISQRG